MIWKLNADVYINSHNSVQETFAITTHEVNIIFYLLYKEIQAQSLTFQIFLRYLWRNQKFYIVIQRSKYQMVANWSNLAIHNYWIILSK